MRFSEYFSLNRSQSELDFVDIDVVEDTPAYIDPSSIHALPDDWCVECQRILSTFFDSVLDAVRAKDSGRLLYLLGNLTEPNETHLGVSNGRSRGRGLGRMKGAKLAESLSNSLAAQTGLLQDLEDTAFFIEGVDTDIVSDITTNIIRGKLISYTQNVAEYYGIETEEVPSGAVWDPNRFEWEHDFVNLPVATDGKILLVPKVLVRLKPHLKRGDYFRHYLTPTLQEEELENASSSLVRMLKNGEKYVTKSDIEKKYGSGKRDITRLTVPRSSLYEEYKRKKSVIIPQPLEHDSIGAVTHTELPDYDHLLDEVLRVPAGSEAATAYHLAIADLFAAIFYPSLSDRKVEDKIHEGRKRVDIRYTNYAADGFFKWLRVHDVSCKYLYVECKNYGSDVGNPELDQMSSRFSPLRGSVGILACRSFENKELFLKRCRDTALDHRGFVLALDDNDLAELVSHVKEFDVHGDTLPDGRRSDYPLLRERFDQLI